MEHNKIYNLNVIRKSKIFKYRQIYLLILPAIIYFFIFGYIPMYGVTMAFREYRFDKGLLFSPWNGIQYFKDFFSDYDFLTIIKNTLTISFFKLVLYFPIPIIFALMLNEVKNSLFKGFVQTLSYLPNFVSWVVTIAILQQFLSLDGIINQIREQSGLQRIFFMNDSQYFYTIMFLSYIWKGVGVGSIIYLAAIGNVDPSLYEAAKMDGANKLRQIWHITLPCISMTAIVLFILSLAQVLSAGFDQIYLLKSPGNMNLSNIIDTYVIEKGLKEGQFGYSTAVSLFQSVIGLLLIFVTNKISKKVADVGLF